MSESGWRSANLTLAMTLSLSITQEPESAVSDSDAGM